MAILRALLVLVVLAAAGTAWFVGWHAREARETFEAETAILTALAAGTPLDTSRYLVDVPELGFTGPMSRPAPTQAQFARSLAAGRWRREPAMQFPRLKGDGLLPSLFPPPRRQAVVTADGARYELMTFPSSDRSWTMLVQDGTVPTDTTSASPATP